MKIQDEHYDALEEAYAASAKAVHWAYAHWDLDTGIESALKQAMGDEVSRALVRLLGSAEALLANGRGLPCGAALILRAEDFDPDRL